MIKIIIPGEPVAASRPRVTKKGFAFIAKPYKQYKDMAHRVIAEQYIGEPLTGALHIQIKFYRSLQKNLSKAERARRLSGVHRPTQKPDIDNLFKAVTDACTGVVWHDDNQIVSTNSEKHYAEEPRVEILVTEI